MFKLTIEEQSESDQLLIKAKFTPLEHTAQIFQIFKKSGCKIVSQFSLNSCA